MIGVPDDEWGESVFAVVVPTAPVTGRRPARVLPREQLDELQVPAAIEFADELEVDPLGKVLKRELRDRYWHAAQRQI